jgi:DNA-binding NarL/FixJ family response regulator
MIPQKQEKFDLEALDQWYSDHFEELVENYGGKSIAVVEENIVAVADTEREAARLAKESQPDVVPLVLSIPLEEELVCLL